MNKTITFAILLITVGCQANEPADEVKAPLTKLEWADMDDATKYKTSTLERLKDSVPEFQDNLKWQQFFVEEVGPKLDTTNP